MWAAALLTLAGADVSYPIDTDPEHCSALTLMVVTDAAVNRGVGGQ